MAWRIGSIANEYRSFTPRVSAIFLYAASVVIIVLVGILVAGIVDLAATILSIVSLAKRSRGLGVAALALSVAAIVFNFFGWMVVLRGKDTRGEPITWRDDSELYVIVAAQAFVVVLAAIATVVSASRRS